MEEGKDKRESHASTADWSEDCTGCITRTQRIPPSNDTDEFDKKTVGRIKEAEGVSERESRTHARTRMRTRTQAWTSCIGEPIDTTEGGYRRRVYAIQRLCVRACVRVQKTQPWVPSRLARGECAAAAVVVVVQFLLFLLCHHLFPLSLPLSLSLTPSISIDGKITPA